MKHKSTARQSRDQIPRRGREAVSSGGTNASPAVVHDNEVRRAGVTDSKTHTLTRLRRIEGQVRGLQKMVEEERYCADVLVQISSVHEALRAVAREIMRTHLKQCATDAIRTGGARAEAMYDELIELMHRHSR
jgi:CsoR family transcriptional regulator, copper-sensing transcriptional repressor